MALQPIPFGSKPIAPIPFGSKPIAPVAATAPAQPVTPTSQPDLLTRAANGISSILPGSSLGKAIGGSLQAIYQGVKTRSMAPLLAQGQENDTNIGKIVGDTAQAVLTPASLAIGGPSGSGALPAVGRIATNTGLGAMLGGSQAAASGKSILKGAGAGAAAGGALSTAGEGLGAILNQLPDRLVRQALPKLTPGNEEYALKNTKVGSIPSLLDNSKASVRKLGQQVDAILSHPDYATHTGDGDAAVTHTLSAFPNSEYTPATVVATVKGLVPEQAKLVDKVANGSATLFEKNTLRKAIDPIIKKVFTDNPQVSSSKQIGATFANALRVEVQKNAPETVPVFAKLTKEINLRSALGVMAKRIQNNKALGLYDITAALGGLATKGPIGAVAAVAGEKVARSPAVGLAAAHGAKGLAKVLPGAVNALKVPAIRTASSQQ